MTARDLIERLQEQTGTDDPLSLYEEAAKWITNHAPAIATVDLIAKLRYDTQDCFDCKGTGKYVHGYIFKGRSCMGCDGTGKTLECRAADLLELLLRDIDALRRFPFIVHDDLAPDYRLTALEAQSGLARVYLAEQLIEQMPPDHDGRNSWLLNYGRREAGIAKRMAHKMTLDPVTQAAVDIKP